MTESAATDAQATEQQPKALRGLETVRVTQLRHWTDKTFSFSVERPRSFRFRSGEFAMIGLIVDDKPLLRAYSIVSPSWDEKLDFYSIKVPNGPLTSRLQHIKVGDEIVMRPKPVGTLVNDALLPAKRVFMFSTGTGIAPFASLIRDPETYDKFEQVILTHTCREVGELAFGLDLVEKTKNDPLIGELASERLTHITSTTREQSPLMGRITTLIESGKLFELTGGGPLNPETDRVMICGSMEMLNDVRALAEKAGLTEGSNSEPSQYVVEKAFVG